MNKQRLKKQSTRLAVCLSLLLAVGCDGFDPLACYESVKAAYPDAEVTKIPGENWRFLVKTTDGDIIYVETMNGTELTQIFTAFRGN